MVLAIRISGADVRGRRRGRGRGGGRPAEPHRWTRVEVEVWPGHVVCVMGKS